MFSNMWSVSAIIIQFLICSNSARDWNIHLNSNNNEQIIKSPNYPQNSEGRIIMRWHINTLPRQKIELTCDNVLLRTIKTYDCYYGMFTIRSGRAMRRFCEDINNLKIKSLGNRMMIEFRLERRSFGKFQCLVKTLSEPKSYLEVQSEEIDSREHGGHLGPKSTTCPCGWSNKKRIVGGKETKINEYPLMVSLVNRKDNERICGGSIITPYHVLTAAHCVIGRMWNPFSIIVGAHDFSKYPDTEATTKIDVQYFIQHIDFTERTLENDIAIAILYDMINYNTDVGPVCLPVEKSSLANNYVKALGWGLISPVTKIASNVLKSVNLRIVDLPTCASKYITLKADTPMQFCTFAKNKDTCQGDSGGPLLWLDPELNRYVQLGIVSYGKTCASETPAVNTDVYHYMDWINSVIQKHPSNLELCMKDNHR